MSEGLYVDALQAGELEVTGRLVDASNATLFGAVRSAESEIAVIYKPIAGERPLWDFESGTLANRERAAFLVSEIGDFNLVPATVLREGPFGVGAVQRWIDVAEEIDLISMGQSEDPRLRQMALFDAVINNTDRKFGHILVAKGGEVFGCDHGVTFHAEDKLRTVLWQFADEPLTDVEIRQLEQIAEHFKGESGEILHLLSEAEIEATINRIQRLIESQRFPLPSNQWPAVPWPPV